MPSQSTTYAVINASSYVINAIVLTDPSGYVPPSGCTAQPIGSSGAGIGWTYVNGQFVAPPVPTPPTPTAAQQAAAALNAGIEITSTSTPLLNGTYSTSPESSANVNAVTTYILLTGTFINGATQMPWYDMDGNQHIFPSVDEFKAFATAFANYVAAVSIYGISGGAVGPLPSSQVTIA